MPITPEIMYHYLTHLPQRRSLDAALELFDALGYQYADELPLPIRNWPDGIAPRQQATCTLDDIYTIISVALERENITRTLPEEQDELVTKALTQQCTLLIVENLEAVENVKAQAVGYEKAWIANWPR